MQQAPMKEIFLSDAEPDAAMQKLEDSVALKPQVNSWFIDDEKDLNGMWMENSHAVDILGELYPHMNWTWFLVRNRAGVTDGHPKIRFDQNCESISYKFRDIADFAEMYGEGKYSLSHIRKVSVNYFRLLAEPEYRIVEMRGDTEEDVIGVRSEGDADAMRLSEKQASILGSEIRVAAEIQKETGYALTTLTYALRAAAQTGCTLDDKEVEAFIESALEVVIRSLDNATRLFRLSMAVNRRKGNGYTDTVTVD